MKILMAFPNWDNRWIPYFNETLSIYEMRGIYSDKMDANTLWKESLEADVLISMWADGVVHFWSHYLPHKKIISYLRRYELYHNVVPTIEWNNVDALIFVSEYIREMFNSTLKIGNPKKTYCIPNCVDLEEFPFKETNRESTKIALVCTGAAHKNIGLAAQILQLLPGKYTIHHIGKISQPEKATWNDYFRNLGLENRWVWNRNISAAHMPEWYKDKDFILSTSISEGNPNNVLEGMATGCKPVVHNWPGAKSQFGVEHVFNTVEEAVSIIYSQDFIPGKHRPKEYRDWVEKHYSLDNIKKIHEVIKEVME